MMTRGVVVVVVVAVRDIATASHHYKDNPVQSRINLAKRNLGIILPSFWLSSYANIMPGWASFTLISLHKTKHGLHIYIAIATNSQRRMTGFLP